MRYLILGFGVVGKSILRFMRANYPKNYEIAVWDERTFNHDEQAMLEQARAASVAPNNLQQALEQADVFIPSPGIAPEIWSSVRTKLVSEFDLFAQHHKGSVIGVTGTLGKTSVTQLITQLLLQCELSFIAAGNIGLPMLDWASHNKNNGVVLELSSFQLEQSSQAVCDVAVWTNIFDNHLDRHQTRENYVNAKLRIVERLGAAQSFVASCQVLHELSSVLSPLLCKKDTPALWAVHICSQAERLACQRSLTKLHPLRQDLYAANNLVMINQIESGYASSEAIFASTNLFPQATFLNNTLLAVAALRAYGISQEIIINALGRLPENFMGGYGEHRILLCHQSKGVDFYNDSKATVMASTRAAIDLLIQRYQSIILILGGLGKGVDRTPLAQYVTTISQITSTYTFGKTDPAFSDFTHFATLDELMEQVHKIAQPGDCVLFSPSGSSYDCYTDYKQRGKHFTLLAQVEEWSV